MRGIVGENMITNRNKYEMNIQKDGSYELKK